MYPFLLQQGATGEARRQGSEARANVGDRTMFCCCRENRKPLLLAQDNTDNARSLPKLLTPEFLSASSHHLHFPTPVGVSSLLPK